MIEELTPLVLAISMLLVITVSSSLSLLISTLVLVTYRHRVLDAMAQPAGDTPACEQNDTQLASRTTHLVLQPSPCPAGSALYGQVLRATRRDAWRTAVAGLAFALVIAIAAGLALAQLQTPVRFALSLWVCSWPTMLALALTTPLEPRLRAIGFAAYFALFPVGILVSEVTAQWSGSTGIDYLYTTTPLEMFVRWLAANGPPTAFLMLFVNRRVRAVGPLLLGFSTAMTSSFLAAYLLLMTPNGWQWLELAAKAAGMPTPVALLLLAILALLVSTVLGLFLLNWIKRAYLRKQLNDRSLTLDALWLLFASWYGMALTLAGLAWVLAGALGFAAYKLAKAWACRRFGRDTLPLQPRELAFLRVFSLGARSDRLFEAITRYWRHIGSVDLITGPDVAHSTLQPHQLLDFLVGRLARHFITDANTLDTRMRQRDMAPDRDGRFRVNNFFCHADTWESALPRLVKGGDVVLMDLRSFSGHNAGCVHELQHLVSFIPLRHCVFAIDDSTDQVFLQRTLDSAWQVMPVHSPNRSMIPSEVNYHHLGRDGKSVRELLRRLCDAA